MSKKLITWTDKLIIDNSVIDKQHQKLIDLINELYSAFLKGSANEVIGKIIDELAEYTVYHFKTEEDFFEKVNYSNKTEHIAEHKSFVDEILEFNKKLLSGKTNLSYDIMIFLRNWLQKHILISDKKYVPFLNTKKDT